MLSPGRATPAAVVIGILSAATALTVACTPSGTAGPQANVAGSWTLQAVFYADSDTLQITGLVMTLDQSGSSFNGTYSGAVISVYNRPNHVPSSTPPTQGRILTGHASGATVTFALDTTSQPFRGVMNDSLMEGSGKLYFTGSQGQETFVGGWTATKNPS